MNIITEINNRIEAARLDTKAPCKNYATEAAAERAVKKMADTVAKHFSVDKVNYIVFYNEAWGRWTTALDMTGVLNDPKALGGFIGIAASEGFYSY